MSTLNDLVRRPSVSKQELMDVLDTLASGGRDLGVRGNEAVAMLDRCDPPLVKADLEQIRGYCRGASRYLEGSGRSWAAQDWSTVLDAVEKRIG